MLKPKELLFAMTELPSDDILRVGRRLGYLKNRRRGLRKTARVLLVAAVFVSLLTATAYAAGWFGLRQRVSPVETMTQVDLETGESLDPGESGILSRSAYNDEPAGKAHAAWISYMDGHRASYTNLSNDDAKNWHPDDPELRKLQPIYGVFDEAAMDQLLAIREEYGVKLHTDLVIPPTTALFLRVTGLEPFLCCENGMDAWPTAYVYEDGSYHAEGGEAALSDGTVIEYTVDCGRRGVLDPAYLPVYHMEGYTEREYTNARGDRLVLSVSEERNASFIFYDSEDYLVTVRSGSDRVEELADCFDFAAMVRLHPDLDLVLNSSPTESAAQRELLTLRDFAQTEEYLASSAFQQLFNDYYLPISNERLAQVGSSRPEGFSQLYYYGSFPTGIAEVDEGLSEILAAHPLEDAGQAEIIWYRLPFHAGGIKPDGGMEPEAYDRAEAEGSVGEDACFALFGKGHFLQEAKIETVIIWENGARYCEFRLGNLTGTLHYIPKGCFYPLFHPILKPESEGWAYDTACGEQVYLCAVTGVSYPDTDCGYILYETAAAYLVITGSAEPFALEMLANAVDFRCFS